MKIYGGHDYYDCGMAYGQDPAIVLVRKDEPIEANTVSFPSLSLDYYEGAVVRRAHTYIHVVFCDKVYHGVLVEGRYFWSAESLRKHLATLRDTQMVVAKHWIEKKRRPLEDYFAVDSVSDSLRETMIKNQWAILKVEDWCKTRKVTMNPSNLKACDFAKAIDPYTAYQELSMWVGGVLGGVSPSIVMITDDRILLEGHGFDHVVSFRGPRL